MSKIKIKGKVVYQNIATGFWGIVDESGKEWRPVNMPEQLKTEGKTVTVEAKEVQEEMSVFMWGTAVKITGFHTLTPQVVAFTSTVFQSSKRNPDQNSVPAIFSRQGKPFITPHAHRLRTASGGEICRSYELMSISRREIPPPSKYNQK